MSRAADAFTHLQNAMRDADPACQDDDRFVSDDVQTKTLANICESCPLFDLCTDYAQLARPTGGIWAGKRYNKSTPNKEKS